MRPTHASLDEPNGSTANPISVSSDLRAFDSTELPYLNGFTRCEFGHVVAFSDESRTMGDFVRMVFRHGLPRQVARVEASLLSVSARVSGLVSGGWRRAIDDLAHCTMHFPVSALMGIVSVASSVSEKRPYEAFVSHEGH
jgi:hypothetical protein